MPAHKTVSDHPDFNAVLKSLLEAPELEALHHEAAKEAIFAPIPEGVHPELVAALKAHGISKLYSHQAKAFDLVQQGKDIVVVTPTASGKTLCYNLPVINNLYYSGNTGRAIYLFPTKALSNDQMHELIDLGSGLKNPLKVHTFDGDTPGDARQAIRKMGDIIITNPDMLHQGILPHHTKWVKLFTNLRFIVIDELHTYRGVFGSHVTNVLRRLLRIAAFYGAKPQIICCSATIANPRELASRMVGRDVALIDESGAPRGERYLAIYNPPLINEELGIRASYLKRAQSIALSFILAGSQTILFVKSRIAVERLTKLLKEALTKLHKDSETIQGYRGGYLPSLRRKIEEGLRNGSIKGVISTNALELGIDIGSLDVCCLAGYPGTIASTWQQAGRVGRQGGISFSVLVTSSSPMDQYIAGHPDYLFKGAVETARIDPDNLIILLSHLKCAAFELPFVEGEKFGALSTQETSELLEFLQENEMVHLSGGRYHWVTDSYPANEIGLRSIAEGNFAVTDITDGHEVVIGEVDYFSAPETIHPKAIYMVEGVSYEVCELDWEGRKAYVKRATADYYTDAMTYSKVTILDVEESAPATLYQCEAGEVRINREVVGFKKMKFDTSENVGYDMIKLPEQEMHTSGFWLTLNSRLLEERGLNRQQQVDALLGLAHALHIVAAVALMCDMHDLGRSVGDKSAQWFAKPPSGPKNLLQNEDLSQIDNFEPTIYLYDNYPGGVGLAPAIYERKQEFLHKTMELIRDCHCAHGCPACIGPALGVDGINKDLVLKVLGLLGESR